MSTLGKKFRGFTLVELLVVLAVMGALMGMLGFSILGGGADVYSGQRQVLSLLHQARTAALGSGKEARLIVHADPSDSEKYMRHLGIVVRDDNASDVWSVVEEGLFLPDGLWLVDSSIEVDSSWMGDAFCSWSSSDETNLFKLGRLTGGQRIESASDSVVFKYVGFDSTGAAIAEDFPKMPRVVIAPGQLRANGGELFPYFANAFEVTGIEVRPFGGILCLDFNDFSSNN
ncbi:prepilin-type N-terminal cleavage/methylation domain-containing protein [Opitutales bacterium]|nr:prepilin-type N-terminal cleavage/methylation domain-containing protein [Opitutales bacterium]